MRRFVLLLALIAPLTPTARAGIVVFDPPEVAFDPASPFRVYEFDVYVDVDDLGGVAPALGAVNVLLQSEVMKPLAFLYSEVFCEGVSSCGVPPIPVDVRGLTGLFVGGFSPAGLSTPVHIGTLFAWFDLSDLGWLAEPPNDAFFVDSRTDAGLSGISLGVESEPLFGAVRLVPEPTTALLLLTGALALARRPRRVVRDVR